MLYLGYNMVMTILGRHLVFRDMPVKPLQLGCDNIIELASEMVYLYVTQES